MKQKETTKMISRLILPIIFYLPSQPDLGRVSASMTVAGTLVLMITK